MNELERQPNVPLIAYYLANVSNRSRRTVWGTLQAIAEITGHESAWSVPWQDLSPEVVRRIIEEAAKRYQWSTTTIKFSSALSGVARTGLKKGVWTQQQYEDLKEAAYSQRPSPWNPAAGRALRIKEMRELVQAADSDRDRLILLLGMILGLRRSEIVGLDCGDVNSIARTLRVRGKGAKLRYVPLPHDLLVRLASHAGTRPGHFPLFVNRSGARLSDRSVWNILERTRRVAGVDPCSPHDLRRTSITQMLDAGHDPLLVAKCVGHSNPSTTMVYDRRGDERSREAFAQLARGVDGGRDSGSTRQGPASEFP